MTDTKPTNEIAECKHRRYSVDAHEQTGECYDCGASGKMRFIVDDAELAAIRSQHEWDATGERCVKCGDKDWMGGLCNSIKSQPVPVEPDVLKDMRYPWWLEGNVKPVLEYIDSLQFALQVAKQRGDEYRDNGQRLLEAADGWKLRAEKAEERNKRLVEYVSHQEGCDMVANGIDGDCPCGVLGLLQEVGK